MEREYPAVKSLVAIAAVLLMISGLLGCATTVASKADATGQGESEKSALLCSGFLGDYSQLKPGGKDRAGLVYLNPNAQWSSYKSVIIVPVEFWDKANSTVPIEEQKTLSTFFYNTLRENLQKDFKLVDQPGPGVLILRTAITNATAATPCLRSISVVIPQARLLNAAQSLATDSYAFTGSARAEGEITDSLTGERLAAMVDERKGGMSLKTAAQWKWGDAENILTYWAQTISKRLVEVRTGGVISQ
ncbi:DUF3313 domain-containing protein [Desulforhabdus sp. TSK]|uniref:DUF3313 domain-containing protein n=1 Tax=Desulforhabdus sp. TSK TaxID=2925014 RepID=UPI001FC7EFFD|nr:DUF3313 domain-containing protein [Desulforhabdus sp. TSK]GKT10308.1 lipoprotein [Desulforhabdus sp. TSK]